MIICTTLLRYNVIYIVEMRARWSSPSHSSFTVQRLVADKITFSFTAVITEITIL